jgi:hypothetical protein
VVTIRIASLTFNNSTFCPHSVFMCFVWISEQTAIISLYSINWLVFITETGIFTVRYELNLYTYLMLILVIKLIPWPLFQGTPVTMRAGFSLVIIATRYGLEVRESNPSGVTFSTPVRTGPGARPASCTMGTASLSRGVKRPGRGTDYTPHLAPGLNKNGAVPLLPPPTPVPPWLVIGRTL